MPSPKQEQDLLQKVKPPEKPPVHGFWMLLVIEIISVITAMSAGYLWRGFIAGQQEIWLPSILSIVFLAMGALGAIFGASVPRRGSIILLEAVAFLLGWGFQNIEYLGPALAVMLIFSAWGDSSVREEMSDRMRIKIMSLTRMKIGRTFTGFLLAGLILTIPIWKNSSVIIPEKQFKLFFSGVVSMATVVDPNLKLNSSIRDLASGLARKQFMVNEDFVALPQEDQDREVEVAANALIKQAEGSLKMSVSPENSTSEIFYRYVSNAFLKWRDSFGEAFFLLLAIGLFIFLRGIGVMLAWVAMLLADLIFEFLSFARIISITAKPALQEKIVIEKG